MQRYKKYSYQQAIWDKNFHFVSIFCLFLDSKGAGSVVVDLSPTLWACSDIPMRMQPCIIAIHTDSFVCIVLSVLIASETSLLALVSFSLHSSLYDLPLAIKAIMFLNPMLRWIPMIGFNEINHLFISLHPSFVLCHS